jgi:hypothetical protein
MAKEIKTEKDNIVFVPVDDHQDNFIELISKLGSILWQRKFFVLITTVFFTVVSLAISFYIIKNSFRATTTIRVHREVSPFVTELLKSSTFHIKFYKKYFNIPEESNKSKISRAEKNNIDENFKLPITFTKSYGKLDSYNIAWDDKEPNTAKKMLGRILDEIKLSMINDYVSIRKDKIIHLETELEPFKRYFDEISSKSQEFAELNLNQVDLIANYITIKMKLIELRVEDELIRHINISQQPIFIDSLTASKRYRLIFISFLLSILLSFALVLTLYVLKQNMEKNS